MSAHMIFLERRRPLFGTVFLIAILAAGAAHAQDSTIKLGVGTNYSTGDYGTGADVDIFSVPFTAKFETGRWSYGLTVPYISITSEGDVVGGTDKPVVTKKKMAHTNRSTIVLPQFNQILPPATEAENEIDLRV